jgi:hypothetical protein
VRINRREGGGALRALVAPHSQAGARPRLPPRGGNDRAVCAADAPERAYGRGRSVAAAGSRARMGPSRPRSAQILRRGARARDCRRRTTPPQSALHEPSHSSGNSAMPQQHGPRWPARPKSGRGGSCCPECACSRRNSSMRARIVLKSSAARGDRITLLPIRAPRRQRESAAGRRTIQAAGRARWAAATRAIMAAALPCRICSRAASPISASASALRVHEQPNSVPSVPHTMRSAP